MRTLVRMFGLGHEAQDEEKVKPGFAVAWAGGSCTVRDGLRRAVAMWSQAAASTTNERVAIELVRKKRMPTSYARVTA